MASSNSHEAIASTEAHQHQKTQMATNDIPKEIHLGAERLARALKIPNFAEKEQKRINKERQRSIF